MWSPPWIRNRTINAWTQQLNKSELVRWLQISESSQVTRLTRLQRHQQLIITQIKSTLCLVLFEKWAPYLFFHMSSEYLLHLQSISLCEQHIHLLLASIYTRCGPLRSSITSRYRRHHMQHYIIIQTFISVYFPVRSHPSAALNLCYFHCPSAFTSVDFRTLSL